MKTYKIGKYKIEANSPVEAVKICKLLDSNKIKDGYYWNDIRQMCIKHDWYTRGTNTEYNNMFDKATKGEWNADDIALDIYRHSDGVPFDDIYKEVKKLHIYDSMIKDTRYVINDSERRIYTFEYEEKKTGKRHTFRCQAEDGEDARNQLQWWAAEHDEEPYKIISTDMVYDSTDIDELTEEEEKAIDDYRQAIVATNNPKLLELYKHILEEEIEHKNELQNAKIKEAINDDKSEVYLDDKWFKVTQGFVNQLGKDEPQGVHCDIKYNGLYSSSQCDNMMSSLEKVKAIFKKWHQ